MSKEIYVDHYMPYLGCDPEFFFTTDNGEVVGAEKILPKGGLKQRAPNSHTATPNAEGKVIIDGVQAELNPASNTCRANLGNDIQKCFKTLKSRMEEKSVSMKVVGTITISEEEFKQLSDESKKFGCMPDINAYKNEKNKITVDPKVSRVRTAGGHLHVGVQYSDVTIGNSMLNVLKKKLDDGLPGLSIHSLTEGEVINFDERMKGYTNITNGIVRLQPLARALKNYVLTIKLLDIIVGNTCVLFDTDPLNAERRKVYGKAGDFRLTPYGLEYRTLSNFWLKNYKLMSLVTGLLRTAVCIAADYENGKKDAAELILNCVKEKDIINAINNNDVSLAKKNFLKLLKVLKQVYLDVSHNPLTKDSMHYFVHMINRGVNYWFKEEPLEHWINMPEGHDRGIESFLFGEVRKDATKLYGAIMEEKIMEQFMNS